MASKLQIVGGGVGGVVALAVLVVGGGYLYMGSAAQARLDRTWPDVHGKDIPIPVPLTETELAALRAEKLATLASVDPGAPVTEAAPDPLAGVDLSAIAMERAVARGTALVNGRLPCGECHGHQGEGKLVVDAQPVWTWYAPNITRGGRTKDYKPSDWDRIIRHGVKLDGTTATMPAEDFQALSDQEVSDLAAYFMSQPPVDAPQPATVLGPVGKILLGTGKMPLSAEMIDHNADHILVPPDAAINADFGKHVASTCVGCHRTDYTGGPIAQGPPDWPPASNLRPGEGGLKRWTEADFLRVFREGKRPDGTDLAEPMSMVTKMKLTDIELKSMFVYLQTLEAKPTGR